MDRNNAIDNLFLQNPPDSIAKHIEELSSAEHSMERQDYKILDMDMLKEIKREFPDAIIGQPIAQRQTIGALYDVAKGRFHKPCVMLFYGNTGIGKTETGERLGYKWPSIQNGRSGGCAKFPASLMLATGLGLTASPQA